MKTPLKKILVLSVIVLTVLSVKAFNDYYDLDTYGRAMEGPPFMKKPPPWIPGTNGQKEVRVQVLDATTMEPIEGAIVVGGYYGAGAFGGAECVKSESAISDAEGWATLPNDQDERVHGPRPGLMGPWLKSAYKRGYQLADPPRYAEAGGHNEWYIIERTPAPYRALNTEWQIISAKKFSKSHKAALLETKERSRIYLMPSTAETKEERSRELGKMDGGGCGFTMPFEFSKSEGALAAWKAVHQEKVDIGIEHLKYSKDMLDSYEKSYLEFHRRTAKEKSQ
jgi:hypothetical protein